MSENESKETSSCCEPEASSCCEPEPVKAGFFARIFSSIDEKMKAKADEKAGEDCCGGDDSKGGKCC